MIYYVSQKNVYSGNGTKENPFQSIGQAAQIAKAGDTVIIGDGIYIPCMVDPTTSSVSLI